MFCIDFSLKIVNNDNNNETDRELQKEITF